MIPEGCFFNTANDVIASDVAQLFGRDRSAILLDDEQFQNAFSAARRFAIIEANMWLTQGQKLIVSPSYQKLYQSHVAALKRKFDVGTGSSNGDEGSHILHTCDTGWPRCYDCRGFAKPTNLIYRSNKLCARRFKTPRSHSTGGALELSNGYKEYLLHNMLYAISIASPEPSEADDADMMPSDLPEISCSMWQAGAPIAFIYKCMSCDMDICILCENQQIYVKCSLEMCEPCYCQHFRRAAEIGNLANTSKSKFVSDKAVSHPSPTQVEASGSGERNPEEKTEETRDELAEAPPTHQGSLHMMTTLNDPDAWGPFGEVKLPDNVVESSFAASSSDHPPGIEAKPSEPIAYDLNKMERTWKDLKEETHHKLILGKQLAKRI